MGCAFLHYAVHHWFRQSGKPSPSGQLGLSLLTLTLTHPITPIVGHWGFMMKALAIRAHYHSPSSAVRNSEEMLHTAHSLMLSLTIYFLPASSSSTLSYSLDVYLENCHCLLTMRYIIWYGKISTHKLIQRWREVPLRT